VTRTFYVLLIVSACSAAPVYAQHDPARFEPPARLREYGAAVLDPLEWAGVAASTLLDQIRDDPEDWDFGDRAVSNAARFVLEHSIYHGVAAWQDRSTWYYPCECTDIPTRAAHAFAEAFTDHDRSGAPHVSAARIGAPVGAAFAEALWRPDRSVGDAIVTGASSIVFKGMFNIVREFVR
jgi:hypothetical protein